MREFVIVGCVLAVACGGAGSKAGSDSVARDTTTVSGPPATTTPPTPGDTGAPRPPVSESPAPPTASRASSREPAAGSGETKKPGTKLSVTPPVPAPRDSVRGIVSVVGTSFEKRVMVAPPGGARRVEITGPIASLVGHVAGADVLVVGTPSQAALEATSFVVRTVDGAPAIDGTLRTEGTTLYIVTAGGTRTRIVSPPPPLVGHDGARVWITGDPAKGVASFGFIDPPR